MNEEHQKLFDRAVEYCILFHRDETNDYYLIQYLGAILDFIERENKGCLTDLGRMSLAVNVMPIYEKLSGQVSCQEKASQKELVKFCLYMTNAYAVCVLYKGMIEVYKESKEGFIELNPFNEAMIEDMIKFEDRIFDLVSKFKKIMDTYSNLLESKYRTIYNEEKHKGFVKQIFTTQVISSAGKYIPSELLNAKEVI